MKYVIVVSGVPVKTGSFPTRGFDRTQVDARATALGGTAYIETEPEFQAHWDAFKAAQEAQKRDAEAQLAADPTEGLEKRLSDLEARVAVLEGR